MRTFARRLGPVVTLLGAALEFRAQAALQLPRSGQEEDHADDTRSGVIARDRRERPADDKQRQGRSGSSTNQR